MNLDDELVAKTEVPKGVNVLTYGFGGAADVRGSDMVISRENGNVRSLGRGLAEGLPFLIVEIGLAVDKEFLGRLAVNLLIGRHNHLQQLFGGVLLQVEIVIARLPRAVRAAEDDAVALI